MKRIVFLLAVAVGSSMNVFAQGAKNIKINEVMTHNTSSIEDGYGQHEAWIELCNVSHTTLNVRGMYITTNKAVLNKELSVPERQKLMSVIPSNDVRTNLHGHQFLTFFFNSNPNKSTLHIDAKTEPGKPLWVALYDGNCINLIDSVTIPALSPDCSYARKEDGSSEWVVCTPEKVTPNIANTPYFNKKIANTKEKDPHGFAIAILAMGTVFFCLLLLYVFFRLMGIFMDHQNTAKKIANKQPFKPVTKTVKAVDDAIDTSATLLKDGLKTKGIDKKIYIAVISMALKQYQDDVHDTESGIITIKPKNTNWNNLIK